MEDLERLKVPFYKYLNNELDEAEARAFLEHLQSGCDQDVILRLIDEGLDGPLEDELLNKPELLALLNQSYAKVIEAIETQPENSKARLWPKMMIGVAAAVALIVLGIYFFNGFNDRVSNDQFATIREVTPGKIGATLTLGNGKKIRLSDAANGEIAREAGISVNKTATGELVYELRDGAGDLNKINKLSTAKGETYILILPDKSKVWMNAASTLTYTASLNGAERRVRLEGEAYFQVAEDKTRPFVVETRKQTVQVLGTHFNINAYADEENVKTTLLQGSVKVFNQLDAKILKPGEQSSVRDHSISVAEVDTERMVAWKSNKFLFENDDIQYIMRMIARWYDVEVVYAGEMPREKFGGGVSRFDNVSQVLKILESTGGVHFKLEGRRIFVSK
uniref:FecR family protein n=1 Tax=Pedobacter schmidteae TaxID=2201271 RepID=UPI000EAEC7B5|nr:FecR family protein [Pedobacter schmidteae]